MSGNKSKIDQIHDLLPKHLNSKSNTNWRALIDAVGQVDQDTADLISEVRKQFFIKTASRPYIDRLAANHKISRPKLVGMDDPSFRQYIPVLSYQPKQVKLIVDQLLDIFFFKESTTAFISSSNYQPFVFKNGWELELLIDEQYIDRVIFTTNDFTNISNASANEIVAAINRQTKYCYATAYYDSVSKNTFIKIFSNTVGSKGSLRVNGGRANIALRLNGFIDVAGNGINTQWNVTKIGDQVNLSYIGGTNPNLNVLEAGDIIIIDLTGNEGSFAISNVDLVTNSVTFTNLFATVGTFTNLTANDVKFIRPNKYVAYLNPKRAMTWETSPGEITVEMPTSPPVVKRSLQGSIHVNGVFSQMSNRNSNTSIDVVDAYQFPESGVFFLERADEIKQRILTPTENNIVSRNSNSRLQSKLDKYTYSSRVALTTTGDSTEGSNQLINLASIVGLAIGQQVTHPAFPPYSRVTNIIGNIATISFPATSTTTGQTVKFLGNTLTGISPSLPAASSLNEYSMSVLSRNSNVVTGVTPSPHGYNVGDTVIISNSSGIQVATTTANSTIGSAVLTSVASMSGVAPGIVVTGSGIPSGTTIVSNTLTTITLSNSATSSVTGLSITLSENLNVSGIITTVTTNSFSFDKIGTSGIAVSPGVARVERIGLANSGSKIIISNAIPNTVSRITGSYMWDKAASFVLSSNTATISDQIKSGKIVRLLNIGANTIPSEGGFLIFDYGRNTQEGPVRYLYKPTSTTIAIDPSYTFKFSHSIGSSVVSISQKGPHQMSGKGYEYPAYITDPSEARIILEDLIKSVKSAGIFVNFLIRYPDQIYGILDVYNQQGLGAGTNFSD